MACACLLQESFHMLPIDLVSGLHQEKHEGLIVLADESSLHFDSLILAGLSLFSQLKAFERMVCKGADTILAEVGDHLYKTGEHTESRQENTTDRNHRQRSSRGTLK